MSGMEGVGEVSERDLGGVRKASGECLRAVQRCRLSASVPGAARLVDLVRLSHVRSGHIRRG